MQTSSQRVYFSSAATKRDREDPPKAQSPINAQAQTLHAQQSPSGEWLHDNPPKGQGDLASPKLSGRRTEGVAFSTTYSRSPVVLLSIYLIAITAEAMSGALAAGRRNMDLFCVSMIAFLIALADESSAVSLA